MTTNNLWNENTLYNNIEHNTSNKNDVNHISNSSSNMLIDIRNQNSKDMTNTNLNAFTWLSNTSTPKLLKCINVWILHIIDNKSYGVCEDMYNNKSRFNVGGTIISNRTQCISAHIDKTSTNKNILKLNYVKRHPECALNGITMEKGGDTELLIKASLKFIDHICYTRDIHLVSVYFFDASVIDCDDNSKANLALLSLLKYGETWYQRKFGAIAKKSTIKRNTNFLEALDNMIVLTPNQIWHNIYKNTLITENILNSISMHNLSWKKLFIFLIDKFGCAAFNQTVSTAFMKLMKINVEYYDHYLIPIDTVREYNIAYSYNKTLTTSIGNYIISGGKKYTHKRNKRNTLKINKKDNISKKNGKQTYRYRGS